jgi:hypothetical protein
MHALGNTELIVSVEVEVEVELKIKKLQPAIFAFAIGSFFRAVHYHQQLRLRLTH